MKSVVEPKNTESARVVLALLIAFVLAMLFATPAQAATFKVTNTRDDGAGSLRAAIKKANSNGKSDTIRITRGGTITLRNPLPALNTNIKISGPGADRLVIRRGGASGTPKFRVFTVGKKAIVSISGITVAADRSGCFVSESCGGIKNLGKLTVNDSIIRGNAGDLGGGIENHGSLTVNRSLFSGNAGGGIGNAAGGTARIVNSTVKENERGIVNARGGTVTVVDSVIDSNSNGHSAGGIFNRGEFVVSSSTVSNNSGGYIGGGIYNVDGGSLTVDRSTISGNSADMGGGIASSSSRLTVTNSTISGNYTITGSGNQNIRDMGGGIYKYDGSAEIRNSTIAKNTAPAESGGGIASNGNGGDRITVSSSIIADNTGNAVQYFSGSNPFVSNGYNLIGHGNGASAFNRTGDRMGAAAGLGPLANNGGSTLTHALLSGSPAINTGSNANCPATDQRGVQRPRGGTCDKGAFELDVSA